MLRCWFLLLATLPTVRFGVFDRLLAATQPQSFGQAQGWVDCQQLPSEIWSATQGVMRVMSGVQATAA